MNLKTVYLAAVLFVWGLLLSGCTIENSQGCVSDSSCQDDRICWQGACTSEERYVALDVRSYVACAVTAKGYLECEMSPEEMPREDGFVDMSTGLMGGCGLRADGTSSCWGQSEATHVPPGLRLKFLDIGSSTACGIRDDDALVCWTGDQVDVIDGSFLHVSVVFNFWCAVETGGEIMCSTTQIQPPAGKFKNVSFSIIYHSWEVVLCGVSAEGDLTCREVTDGEDREVWSPSGTFVSVSNGGEFACGLRDDGKVICSEFEGIYKPEDEEMEREEIDIEPPDERFVSISASSEGACGITVDGRIRCWGSEYLRR